MEKDLGTAVPISCWLVGTSVKFVQALCAVEPAHGGDCCPQSWEHPDNALLY